MMGQSRGQRTVSMAWVLWAACAICAGCLALLLVTLGGCGSVADVGSGASRGGVEPVRGAYGYGGSGYTGRDLEDQQKRVESLARSNQKARKKPAALLQQVKQLPDEATDTVAETEPEDRATLDADLKTKLLLQEQTRGAEAFVAEEDFEG